MRKIRNDRMTDDHSGNIIEINGLTYSYGKEEAISEIDLMMQSPKIYGLIGRNGAGKTTLLSLLAAFRDLQGGELRVFGETPYENPGVLREVSYHGKPDYEEEDEKVGDYFDFYRRYRPKFDKGYAVELSEIFEIPLKKPINRLSQGKQSALNGILGLASRTPVTIFDEVYLGMDAPARMRFYKEVLQEQMTHPRLMILSTHLILEMEYLFDHVVIMDHGKILVDEPVDEVLERGFAVTGEKSKVAEFTEGMTVLNREELGPTQKAILLGKIDEEKERELDRLDLQISDVSLQDLFIHMTERKKDTEDLSEKGGGHHE